MSLWTFGEITEKISVRHETERLESVSTRFQAWQEASGREDIRMAGRKASERGRFLEGHPKNEVYMVHMRTQ